MKKTLILLTLFLSLNSLSASQKMTKEKTDSLEKDAKYIKYKKEKLIQINFSFLLSYNSILAGFTNSGTGAYRLIFSFFTG